MVVRLRFEGDCISVADVHRPSVVTDPGKQRPARGDLIQGSEPLEVDLGGFVRTVF